MSQGTMLRPWIWAAIWDSGEYEAIVVPYYEAMRRRDIALGLGGPRRILTGAVVSSVGAETMLNIAKRRLGVV